MFWEKSTKPKDTLLLVNIDFCEKLDIGGNIFLLLMTKLHYTYDGKREYQYMTL